MLQETQQEAESRLSSAADGKLSLTQVWEYITRAKQLPDGLDLDVFFSSIHDRLRNPEWEVRQHALRVLRDVTNVLDINKLDEKVEGVLEDLIVNLGHVSPAVRKAAVDSLRTYLKRTERSDCILENLIENGVQESQHNNIHVNITFGIILSVPFLIFPKTSKKTLIYVIHQLLEKSLQITQQEVSLRSLVRIKYIIGEEWFKTLVESTETPEAYEKFEKLCSVYDLHPKIRDETRRENEELRCDFQEFIQDKVILETEIKLNSGSAITMQIHEETRNKNDSDEETKNVGGIVKIFPDEEYDDSVRRTPRRVRFGGEIVKLRTPDSDSNNTNEEPVIKIEAAQIIKPKIKLSQIPVRKRSESLSEPSSPVKGLGKRTQKFYQSSPELRQKNSKIPLRRSCSRSEVRSKIKITINEWGGKEVVGEKNVDDCKGEKKSKGVVCTKKSNASNEFRKIPTHNEVEMLHNLMRSPEPKTTVKTPETNKTEETNVTEEQKIQEIPIKQESPTRKLIYNSFKVCPETTIKTDEKQSLDLNIGQIPHEVVKDLQNKEHLKLRLSALETLLKLLKKPGVLESTEPKLSRLLSLLFSAELQPFLRLPAQEALSYVFTHAKIDVLESRMNYIVMNLCKMATADGVRLGLEVARRVDVAKIFEHTLSDATLRAKSTKTRQGCLQIMIATLKKYPNSDIDITNAANRVSPLLKDKKRKVRQAALETLAKLAQIGSTRMILDAVGRAYPESSEKEQLLKVVRYRLCKKQLSSTDSIPASTSVCESELEWLSIEGATVTLPRIVGTPCKLRKRVSSSQAKLDYSNESRNTSAQKSFWKEHSRVNALLDGRISRVEKRNEGEGERETMKEEPPNSSNTKVWALDPVTFAASKDVPLKNGAPKPILLLHQTHLPHEYHHTKRKSTATNTESSEAGYPRGRSFSPTPKESYCEMSFEEDGRREYRRLGFRKNYFRKSFSSDNLDNRRSNAAGFSSSCSSTSTASSRSGTCNSRIPMPISYTERFRFKTRHNGLSRSPLAEGFPRSKHEETSLETLKLPPPDPKVIESFSSGSESSGYFTPPAEPPAEPVQTIPKEPPSFIQLEKPDPKEFLERSLTPSPSKSSRSSSSAGSQKVASFVVQECEETSERSQSAKSTKPERISLDEVDFNERRYFGERPFAKSEVNINQSSDEQRKSVSSAPVYQTFNETTINITLPGAIETVVQNTSEVIEIKKTPPEKPRLKRNLSRQLSKRSQGSTPTYPETLAPFQKPKEALNEVIRQLESNDWELTMNGLRGLVRLKRHHHEYLESQMHVIVAALIKQIRNLRSQVARMACKAAAELFSGVLIKKSLEMELEELAAPLLQRTADTNRFLRSDANAALDEMCGALPPPKVVQVVALKGCGHPNALVRATAARLLCNLTQKLGAEKVFQLPKETRDKLLQMGANMLTDGNLETRKYAKMMLGNLCSHAHFQRTMFDVVPTNTLRHIEKTLRTLK